MAPIGIWMAVLTLFPVAIQAVVVNASIKDLIALSVAALAAGALIVMGVLLVRSRTRLGELSELLHAATTAVPQDQTGGDEQASNESAAAVSPHPARKPRVE